MYVNIWAPTYAKTDHPYHGMTMLGMTVGRHVLEVEYQSGGGGTWVFTDHYGSNLTLMVEHESRSFHRAWVLAMRRARQLGFYPKGTPTTSSGTGCWPSAQPQSGQREAAPLG